MIVANTCIAEIDDWFNENNCNPMVLNHEDGLRTSVSLHYPAFIVYIYWSYCMCSLSPIIQSHHVEPAFLVF